MSVTCQAWEGPDALECQNDVVGRDETGTPLCAHHLDKSDVYDYPRTIDVDAEAVIRSSEVSKS